MTMSLKGTKQLEVAADPIPIELHPYLFILAHLHFILVIAAKKNSIQTSYLIEYGMSYYVAETNLDSKPRLGVSAKIGWSALDLFIGFPRYFHDRVFFLSQITVRTKKGRGRGHHSFEK